MKKKNSLITAISAIAVLTGIVFAGGLNFGPVMAVKEKVKEYQSKEISVEEEQRGSILSGELNGTYSGDCRLAASNSPYTVTGSVLISGNLYIDAGVIIKFQRGFGFTVSGTKVTAPGTKTNPIKFTSDANTPAAGDYGYITFTVSHAELNYVTFEYGIGQSISGDSVSTITNCVFSASNSGYPTVITSGEIKYCNFNVSTSTSIHVGSGAGPTITYCNIQGTVYAPSSAGAFTVNSCNLNKQAPYVFVNYSGFGIDATINYWGTTNQTTIGNWCFTSGGPITTTNALSSAVATAGPQ